MPLSWRDRLVLAGLHLVPSRAASHVMFLLRSHPSLTDRWGYHVRPMHYYEPLPDFRTITPEALQRRRVSPAIEFDLEGQRRLLRRLSRAYASELAQVARAGAFDFANDYFAGFDACLYYALIRDLKPRRIIEIGAGYSTQIAALALQRNRESSEPADLICIEPYPAARLNRAAGDIRLITEPVERVPLEHFTALRANDILFIDSTHTVKFDGDVYHELLSIVPRLQAGVWVQVHDVFWPGDYPAQWLIEQRIAFNEQYLLEAFLAFNSAFSVTAANYWLATEYPDEVAALVPESAERTPETGGASLWMRRNS